MSKQNQPVRGVRPGPMAIPTSSRRRIALTTGGAVNVPVPDALTDLLLDRHWQAIAAALVDGDERSLRGFAGIAVGKRELVASTAALVTECIRWADI
jgi:hypothetical protein